MCCSARTSSGAFFHRGGDKVIRRIEKRIADYTSIPVGMWYYLFGMHGFKVEVFACSEVLNSSSLLTVSLNHQMVHGLLLYFKRFLKQSVKRVSR